MPTDELKSMNFTMVVRNAPRVGPFSSDAWNDTVTELANDLTVLAREWNNKIKVIIDQLPDGSSDSSVNVYRNGLDGKSIYVDSRVTADSDDLTFWSVNKSRPVTAEEALRNIYTYINDQIEDVYDAVGTVGGGSGLTTEQKERIGANIFNGSLVSSATSLDGKSERSRLNIIQLAKDLYGGSYALDNDGETNLANSVMAMVDALLELHGGNWDDDIALSHNIVTTDLLDLAGTRTMTGNLNMGTHAIDNVTTLTASSTITTGNIIMTNAANRSISIPVVVAGSGKSLTVGAGAGAGSFAGGDLNLNAGDGGPSAGVDGVINIGTSYGSSVIIQPPLTVTNQALFSNEVHIDGSTHIDNTITVDGATVLNGTTTLNDTLTVNASGYINGLVQATSLYTGTLSVKTHDDFSGSESCVVTGVCTTTDDEPTELWSHTLNASSVYSFEVTIVGRQTDGSDRVMFKSLAMAYHETGDAILGDVFLEFQTPLVSDWTFTWDVSSTDIILYVTGENDTIINWAATIRYQAVSVNT